MSRDNVFYKDPSAILDYSVDWSDWLASSETISSSSWTVPSGITKQSDTNTTTIATIWLSDGAVDTTYECVNHIVTSSSRTDERTLYIVVVDK